MKSTVAVIKRLFASNRVIFIITAVVMLAATTSADSEFALSRGNYAWLLALMTPFIFVFYDYLKLMYLGSSKKDFYRGSMISYCVIAVLISVINTGIFVLIDSQNQTQIVINLMQVCGWTQNGIVVAMLQQAFFLLLAMVSLHTILFMQTNWYGWLTDIIIVAIICIFTPISPLRTLLAGFFKIIMFNSNALLHIAVCLVGSIVIISAGMAVLKRKTL